MKRDEIKKIVPNITDEALDKIMSINGEDINKAKIDTQKGMENDLETARNDLKTAQDTIKTLEKNKGDLEKVQDDIPLPLQWTKNRLAKASLFF